MKQIIFLLATFLTVGISGQDKYDYIEFNKLIEVEGTEFVIATIENRGKLEGVKNRYILFLDTKTGQSTKVEFPTDSYIQEIEQLKIDSLQINKIVISARTVDLDGKKGIDWNDPSQLIILSTNGLERTQLTDSKLFVRTWVVNQSTGTIVVTGHYDTNSNGKYDKTDKNEIGIYDLRSLQLIRKI
ncbi:hypothetical protein N9B82_02375 [Saprospiraceae bacterium]|nr:hypothetical protein [Saprospiraceae bacterium]